ncbi:MAG TPA: MFS transporter, partial [Kiritimatiellia bacterium]|nr:MFS transporter [Kiritimatiellia bacterium]
FDVIEPKYRGSATGLMLTCIFFVGAFAPVILGWAKQTIGLTTAMSYLSIGFLIGGVVLLVAALTSFKDDFINEESVARE